MMKLITLILLFLSVALSRAEGQSGYSDRLSDDALELTKQFVDYDPGYFTIAYPNGDVPINKGVCTDVIIRTYRKLGIDLQKEVHEDMRANFNIGGGQVLADCLFKFTIIGHYQYQK